MADPAQAEALREAIMASSARLGISPVDLATALSYETAGKFDPRMLGPRTQHGQHRGLIQWGEPQAKKYGVDFDAPVANQMQAVERYLTDAGVKPGHELLDIYSAINAGKVGLYNRSDANNGGAPGTVADKVAGMGAHRQKAEALLGGGAVPQIASPPAAAGAPSAGAVPPVPLSLAGPAAAEGDSGESALIAQLAALAKQASAEPKFAAVDLPKIRMAAPPGLAKARALARAMGSMQLG